MDREKYDYDYANDVEMWEIVEHDEEAETWECTGIYAEREEVANRLANIFEERYKKNNKITIIQWENLDEGE